MKSEPAQDAPKEPFKGIRFDGTINLGHLLTFVGFMFAGAGMYTSMDKRVVVLETARTSQQLTDIRRDTDMSELKRTVREDLQVISSKLDRLIERKKD